MLVIVALQDVTDDWMECQGQKNLTAKNAEDCRKERKENLADYDDIPRDSITPALFFAILAALLCVLCIENFNREAYRELPLRAQRKDL